MLALNVLGEVSKKLVFRIKSTCKTHIMSSFTPKSVKRSYSSENLSEGEHFTPKRKCERPEEEYHRYSSSSSASSSFHMRKSLPNSSGRDIHSDCKTPDNSFRRKSFPFQKSNYQSPSSNRSCAADQTPYAADDRRKPLRTILPSYNASELVSLKSESGFIDAHCHLDFLFQRQGYTGTYEDYQKKHEDTFPAAYRGCLAVFCNPFTFSQRPLWEKYLNEKNVWASFGCHPHNAKDYNDGVEKALYDALEHPKVRALGEIGLDYSNRNSCQKEKQFEVFRRQLRIALKKKLPVVIHCREAHNDGMAIVKEILPKDYTIHLHCFTDVWDYAEQWLDEFPNLFIGITNVVTFPSATCVHDVAKRIPLSRLLLETDAPYFIPRGISKGTRFSHPGMAIHVAAQIASLKDVPLEDVLHATRENTKRMYNI